MISEASPVRFKGESSPIGLGPILQYTNRPCRCCRMIIAKCTGTTRRVSVGNCDVSEHPAALDPKQPSKHKSEIAPMNVTFGPAVCLRSPAAYPVSYPPCISDGQSQSSSPCTRVLRMAISKSTTEMIPSREPFRFRVQFHHHRSKVLLAFGENSIWVLACRR